MIPKPWLATLVLSALGAVPGALAREPAPPGCRAVVLEIGSPTADPERQTLGYLCDPGAVSGDVGNTGALAAPAAHWITPDIAEPERGTFGYYAGARRP